jgi:hypothetical protein
MKTRYITYNPKTHRITGIYETEQIAKKHNYTDPYITCSENDWDNARNHLCHWVDPENHRFYKLAFESFEDYKKYRLNDIKNKYQQAMALPITLEVNGTSYQFQADNESYTKLVQLLTVVPPDFSTKWATVDNQLVDIDVNQLKTLAGTIITRNEAYFVKQTEYKNQIKNCNQPECLNSLIVWFTEEQKNNHKVYSEEPELYVEYSPVEEDSIMLTKENE